MQREEVIYPMKKILVVGCAAAALAGLIQPQALAKDEKTKTESAVNARGSGPAPPQAKADTKRDTPSVALTGRKPQSNPPLTVDWAITEDVQEKLIQLGYKPGVVNGVVGPKTRDAITKFQQDNSMPPTGEIDRALLRKLGL
jgi:hypothetical protein